MQPFFEDLISIITYHVLFNQISGMVSWNFKSKQKLAKKNMLYTLNDNQDNIWFTNKVSFEIDLETVEKFQNLLMELFRIILCKVSKGF